MQTITNWAALWKELVNIKKSNHNRSMETPGNTDVWNDRAREFNTRVMKRWDKSDSTRTAVISMLEPDTTIMDIGAGTGAWAILFSRYLKKVTAIEPSKAMREVLIENIQLNKAKNIEIMEEKWPAANPEIHDYSFCSHAMYGVTDFPAFVQHMIEKTRKMCFLLIRAPSPDGLITEAFQHIWNQPHDSPNFTIAYNILIQMGIYANVQIEDSDKWFFLTNPSKEEAFSELKSRLGLHENSLHDDYLKDLLERRLVKHDDEYVWPGGVQSALIYWSVNR